MSSRGTLFTFTNYKNFWRSLVLSHVLSHVVLMTLVLRTWRHDHHDHRFHPSYVCFTDHRCLHATALPLVCSMHHYAPTGGHCLGNPTTFLWIPALHLHYILTFTTNSSKHYSQMLPLSHSFTQKFTCHKRKCIYFIYFYKLLQFLDGPLCAMQHAQCAMQILSNFKKLQTFSNTNFFTGAPQVWGAPQVSTSPKDNRDNKTFIFLVLTISTQ